MSVIRRAVERLSRRRVIRRRLPADLGGAMLYVSPDAALQLLRPQLSSDLFDFAREFVKPGSVVWDVVANVGLLAFSAAQRAGPTGRVLAVEADVWLVDLLRRSAAAQAATNARVEVLPVAACSTNGIADFNIAARGRASNFVGTGGGRNQAGGIRETVQVMTCTLDWLLDHRPAPSVLKIDVEGAEADVLLGGEKLLRDVRPVILCEVGDSANAAVTRLLVSNSYRLYDWDDRRAGPKQVAAWNSLAIPIEHVQPR